VGPTELGTELTGPVTTGTLVPLGTVVADSEAGADGVPVAPAELGIDVTVPGAVGTLLAGTLVGVCGWQTSLVQVTVAVTTTVLVLVHTEVIVLPPEVKVEVPTGQVVVV